MAIEMTYSGNKMKVVSLIFPLNFWIILFFLVQLSVAGDQTSSSEIDKFQEISPAPTEITSESMDFDVENRFAVFDGNVKVIDDRMRLDSDKMVVHFDENNKLQRIEAVGNVVINSDGNIAKGGQAVYDFKEGRVVLSIDPVLMQGDNRVIGAEKIIYSRGKEKFVTEGGTPRVIFYDSKNQNEFQDLFNQPEKKTD